MLSYGKGVLLNRLWRWLALVGVGKMLVGVGGPLNWSQDSHPFPPTFMLTIAESARELCTPKEISSKWSITATYSPSTHVP